MADDGHTINVGPVTIGEPLPTDVPHPCSCRVCAAARERLELVAERDALAAALADIADGECMNMDEDCTLLHPTDPGEWCHTCVAEVTWAAWKMGALR